jgi:segregation and condensation protein A
MVEKTIPWWRKALQIALSGLRSGFGFFPRPAKSEPVPEPIISGSIQERPEEETTLIEPSPEVEVVVAAPIIPAEPVVKSTSMAEPATVVEDALPAEPAPVPAPAIDKTVPSNPIPAEAEVESEATLEPVEEAETVVEAEDLKAAVEEPAGEAESELEAEAPVEPELAETPEDEAVVEVVEEPVGEPEALIEAEPELAETPEDEVVVEAIEEPVGEAESELEAVAPVEPELAETPEDEAVVEAVDEPVNEPEFLIEAEPEPAMAPAPEVEQAAPATEPPLEPAPPLTAATEPAPEPIDVPVPAAVAVPQRVLKPQPSAEEKEAARLAARQKKLDEGSEESPFSVIVGQVYDGPLDLLLDLIRKQDIDIYDIPIAIITSQFLAYVNQLKAGDVDVAGDFIYTASLLIHIKSKMLLPHTETGPEASAEDPRRELVERLLEHERFKNAAQMLQQKQMLEAATWSNPGMSEFKDDEAAEPEIAADTVDLVRIFREILERARNRPVINVEEDSVTVGQMIQFLARRLTMEDKPVALRRLLSHTRSERALIAMFLALLEMVRLQAILLRQDRQFSEIFIKKHSGFDALMNEGLGNARDDWR